MENECIFCLENNGILIPNIYCRCKYHYHTDCVDRWLAQNNKCVMCTEKMVSRIPSPVQERQNATDNIAVFSVPPYYNIHHNTVIAVPPPPSTYSYPQQPPPPPPQQPPPQLYQPQQSQPPPPPQLYELQQQSQFTSTRNTPYTTVSSPSNIEVIFHTPSNNQEITNIQHMRIRRNHCKRKILNILCGSIVTGTICFIGIALFELFQN